MRLKGSATIEMAYIMPVIFFTFIVVVYSTFYFHDKRILNGLAAEVLVVGSQQMKKYKEVNIDELKQYFDENAKKKTIFMSETQTTIHIKEQEIILESEAKQRKMAINIYKKMKLLKPETFIRNLRKVKIDESNL